MIIRATGTNRSIEDMSAWLTEVLSANKNLKPRGIRVSVQLFQAGLRGEFNNVKIAQAPELPYDVDAEVEFFDEPVQE